MDKTVIYLTDNQLDPRIAELCRKNILASIGDLPLVSVSQSPLDFGTNICVGPIGRSSLTLNIQMQRALELVDTEFVAIAEHDCLYTPEHFEFTPPDEHFWYNTNVWLMQYAPNNHPELVGTFSIFKNRKANSQLICSTESQIRATSDRIEMMGDPAWVRRYPTGRIGEAGAMDYKHAMKLSRGASIAHIRPKLADYVTKYIGKTWSSELPNIDIRHDNNFTKNRWGNSQRYELPYWGTMEDVLNATEHNYTCA